MNNHYQSNHNPSRPSNNPNSSHERLRPFSRLRDRPGDIRGGASLPPPPSKLSVRQNISREYNEREKESGSSSGMLDLGTSMSSDEDLRAIKVQLEELLEPDSSKPERTMETKPKSQTTLPLSSGKIKVHIAKSFHRKASDNFTQMAFFYIIVMHNL